VRIAAGTEVSAPVHHFDMYATAAAAAGAPLPDDREIDGIDLVPFATDEADGVPHDALFWRSGASQTAIVGGWKLNVSDPPDRRWLFDLSADPELLGALATHNAEQAEPLWASQLSVPQNIDKDITRPDAPDDDYIYWSN
jgi:arylsulfatase A-like enzyme